MTDGDDAGSRGDDDHRQHQQEAAECQLADRKRERSLRWRIRRQFRGHVIEAGLQSVAIYDVIRARGNMLESTVKGGFRGPRNRRPGRKYRYWEAIPPAK